VKVEGSNASTLLRLLDDLEEHDEIQQVFSNFDIDDSVMEDMK
jgi:transcriptional/translational regulatory protein YebC/TACO1